MRLTSHQIFINAGGLYTAAFLPRSLMQPLVWLFVLTLQGDQASATVEMKMNCFRPAYAKRLIAKAKLNHRGKTLAVGTAEMIDPNRKAVAAGSATYMILSPEASNREK
ncbi:PaaI family thioesterase [Saccharococcus caldoxylosilyticus]|uniref:PaaI family thioesterase n=1 Tax=Saccharococcus caldoxylosilyticus TaxID=81408 RepID=UPI001FCB9040|nr:PaaI family thioesterase [Parageobacillus caldoxylosilyticus]